MNITFLVGNGFDINCGLKCTYKDAYKTYCMRETDSDLIEQFRKEIGDNIETWSDFEQAMAQYMPNFKSENDFLRCLRDFKRHLNAHLLGEQELFFERIKASDYFRGKVKNELEESLFHFYDGINHDITSLLNERISKERNRFTFISFNYTSVINRILQLKNLENGIIHIHGNLDEDMVLGVDNEQQLPSVGFPISDRTRRAFLKPFFNNSFDQARFNRAKLAIEISDIICIFGMSLGDSDLTWKQSVLDRVKKNANVELFVFRNRYAKKKYSFADERLDAEEDAKIELLSDFGLTKADAKDFSNRIHIPCGRNIFNFNEVIETNYNAAMEFEEKKQELKSKLPSTLVEV